MIRETDYAKCLASAGTEERIERLLVRASGQEEIRFSWWKDGTMFMPRPLDLPEAELLPLIQEAIVNGVFSEEFLEGLWRILKERAQTDGG
jgi:hypothetical protein